MKVFLDTNVIIDFCANRAPFCEAAARIVDMGYRGEISLVISSLTFINVAYILRKAFPADLVIRKMEQLTRLCEISPIDETIIKEAVKRREKDFEDCVQYLSACQLQTDVILTRDLTGFNNFPITVQTPDDFLDACCNS
ncbi:PIN domain-containing protein [uncultured Bacteroides sp.]|uniref:type II toxin-antitoxin system VapC family toxin n=1 Tax=uncultured Bacteroides sp. TaxID=162156 RepID=UPI00261433C1|nr:PIN domain-containing protein [uncultured Bacteroides sp.]